MADLKLHLASGPYDRIEALRYGAVRPDGIEVEYETRIPVHSIFVAMAEREEFDVSEMSLSLYTTKRSRALAGGEPFPFVAIPVFPSRVFRHGNFFVNRTKGIETPRDLEGKRIGIQEYRQTAGIWMRGILRDEYGVDTDSIEWVEGGVDVPRKATASDVRPDGREVKLSELAENDTLADALEAGRIDAIIAARQPRTARTCKDIVRLFPDFRAAEQDWFRRTGIFPIMHTVVMREALYRENEWVAQSLYEAFQESKRRAQEQMRYTGAMMYMTPWLYDDLDEMDRVFGGDAWPYGLEPNRAHLETFMRHLVEEGFLPGPTGLDGLYAAVS